MSNKLLKSSGDCSIGAVDQDRASLPDEVIIPKDDKNHLEITRQQRARAKQMESLQILAGGVAHDLNNLLGPVLGYADLILMEVSRNSIIAERVEKIYKAAESAASLIQDLQILSQDGDYDMTPIDFNDVIRAYLDSPGYLRQLELRPDIDLVTCLGEPIPMIHGSAFHLSKVIANCTAHAFEVMPSGGRIEIDTSGGYLDKLRGGYENIEAGEYITFRIVDSGPGLEPKLLHQIFEPYFLKKNTDIKGSGLGLPVIYRIVKDHSGYYDIFSEMGKGTEIVLYFPACAKPG